MSRLLWPAAIAATLLFYSIPLFHPAVSIHWDLADTHYPAQAYIAESLRAGELPHWTPYLGNGQWFLADPRTGAWYPPHWPFFLIGITPRTMQWEIALHALLALAGAFALARKLLGDATAAIIAAPLYAWSGFFAAYSSRLATFEAAALFPWLLWAVLEGHLAAAAGIGGLVALTGDFETAAYCLAMAVLLAAVRRTPWSTLRPALAATAGAILLGAIVWLPWLSIQGDMIRPGEPPRASLVLSALATIVNPDNFDLFSGLYSGPGEIRQFYFYGGLLLVPLAVAGALRKQALSTLAALIAAPLAYAFAASVQIWFAVALGLALAAGSGASYVAEKSNRKRLPVILLCLISADLFVWNMYRGPLVYARLSYDDLYGKRLRDFEATITPLKESGEDYLVWAPAPSPILGPAGGPLLTHTKAAWNAGLLQPRGYDPQASATHIVNARGQLIEQPEVELRPHNSRTTPNRLAGAALSLCGLGGLFFLISKRAHTRR